MSLPDGVTTCLLTYGPITDTFGNLADSITVEVVADRTIVHAASGRTMFDVPVSATADMGGVVQIAVPHTNQSGFRDKQQNSLTGWYYTITLSARFANGGIKSDRKVFQPVIGQTTVDLDLIQSDGMVTPGVTAPTATVTSVNGQTGEVDLSATFAPQDTDWRTLVGVAGDPEYGLPQYIRRKGPRVFLRGQINGTGASDYRAIPAGFRSTDPSLTNPQYFQLGDSTGRGTLSLNPETGTLSLTVFAPAEFDGLVYSIEWDTDDEFPDLATLPGTATPPF